MTQAIDRRDVVWILGAGFSRPLGGPLLRDLLTPGSFRDLQARHGITHSLVSKAAQAVCHVYHYGRAYEVGCLEDKHPQGERLWSDAEEFLDILDSTGSIIGARRIVGRVLETIGHAYASIGRVAVEEMCEAARRLIAAECSGFTRDTNLASPKGVPERWSAHIDWLKDLNERHTLITFNYDRALEEIGKYNRSQGGKGISVRLPGSKPSTDVPTVLKLHGSVDWGHMADGAHASGQQRYTVQLTPHEEFALTADEHRMLVLGTPGPSKSSLTAILSDLWTAAEAAIEAADAIVFVGYRFPPTDANARRRLLRAIETRAKKQQYQTRLALHVVLGPDCPDARRLEELLRFAARRSGLEEDGGAYGPIEARRFRIRVHQLFSQDFFDVYDEKFLMF